jgi:hypothetical protein
VCGDPISDVQPQDVTDGFVQRTAGLVTASDALYILNAAVGIIACEVCVCDVDDSSAVTAVDALATLQFAIGLDVMLVCPTCPGAGA